jgi:hypothetical protein
MLLRPASPWQKGAPMKSEPLLNKEDKQVASAMKLGTAYEIVRLGIDQKYFNLGRQFDIFELTWMKQRVHSYSGYVTERTWKEFVTEMMKAKAQHGWPKYKGKK